MKLRLDPTPSAPVLEVTEELTLNDLAVLRAGLLKIFKSGKSEVVLDLSGAAPGTWSKPEILQGLKSLQAKIGSDAGLLVVACPVAEVSLVKDREGALKLLSEPAARALNRERQLQAGLEALEAEKRALEAKLAQLPGAAESLAILRRNSELKTRAVRLKLQLADREKARPAAAATAPGAPPASASVIFQTIDSVMKHEGLLP